MDKITPVKLRGKAVSPPKAVKSARLGARTVLTDDPWTFVALWLQRNKQTNALFYWNQAREFHDASPDLSLRASPLLHYYMFLNAAKALLSARGISFRPTHGVRRDNSRPTSGPISLNNERIKVLPHGVCSSLSAYFGESELNNTHSLRELFFNIPYIHRTYCLTYTSQTDMFFPIKDCRYVADRDSKQAYFAATITPDFSTKSHLKRLPTEFVPDENPNSPYSIRSQSAIHLAKPAQPKRPELDQLRDLHAHLRSANLVYISGAQTLWYIKSQISGPPRIDRTSVTMTFAAMHRLSELCRYRPLDFYSLLNGQKNWLLSEFIQHAPSQYVDSIAAEITGYHFLSPNVRSPA